MGPPSDEAAQGPGMNRRHRVKCRRLRELWYQRPSDSATGIGPPKPIACNPGTMACRKRTRWSCNQFVRTTFSASGRTLAAQKKQSPCAPRGRSEGHQDGTRVRHEELGFGHGLDEINGGVRSQLPEQQTLRRYVHQSEFRKDMIYDFHACKWQGAPLQDFEFLIPCCVLHCHEDALCACD